jgi:hypothetical protein
MSRTFVLAFQAFHSSPTPARNAPFIPMAEAQGRIAARVFGKEKDHETCDF